MQERAKTRPPGPQTGAACPPGFAAVPLCRSGGIPNHGGRRRTTPHEETMVVKMVVKKEHPDLHRHGLRPPWERAAAERVMAFAWSFARAIRRSRGARPRVGCRRRQPTTSDLAVKAEPRSGGRETVPGGNVRRGRHSHVVQVALSGRADLYLTTGDHADRWPVTTHRDGHQPRRHQAYRNSCARRPPASFNARYRLMGSGISDPRVDRCGDRPA